MSFDEKEYGMGLGRYLAKGHIFRGKYLAIVFSDTLGGCVCELEACRYQGICKILAFDFSLMAKRRKRKNENESKKCEV